MHSPYYSKLATIGTLRYYEIPTKERASGGKNSHCPGRNCKHILATDVTLKQTLISCHALVQFVKQKQTQSLLNFLSHITFIILTHLLKLDHYCCQRHLRFVRQHQEHLPGYRQLENPRNHSSRYI